MNSGNKLKVEEPKSNIDMTLLVAVLLLMLVGLLMVYSSSNAISREHYGTSYHFLKMQAIWCIIGLGVMISAIFFRYSNYQRLAWVLLGIAGFLLLLVYIPGVGIKRGGGTRWIMIWRYSFQPVEFVKIAIVIYIARFLNRNSEHVENFWRGIVPVLIVLAVFFGLIYKQPDFGSVVLISSVVFAMLFIGGARVHQMLLVGTLGALVGFVEILRAPYRLARVTIFLNPWKDPEGAGYHIIQSYYALGAGGILGRGVGAGMQKLHYLPVPHSDFIFATIGEELGFVGTLFIISLYMVIIWRGIHISLSTGDRFGSLLAAGLTSILGIQAAINIGVVTGALPTKGITLPFISFGGSSMLASLAAVGILLNISRAQGAEQRS